MKRIRIDPPFWMPARGYRERSDQPYRERSDQPYSER